MQTKLKLNLEDLAVDSFDTTRSAQKQGTVFGEQCTCYTNCTCPGCPSCDPSCAATCLYTCDDVSCLGGDTCGYTCDDYCAVSRKYTNCNDVCY